jgi:hypothetical protein
MPLLPNGQSCLENIGLTHRQDILKKNEYHNKNEYDIQGKHKNALSDGDGRGRGTGDGGHKHITSEDVTGFGYNNYYYHYQSDIAYQIDSNIRSGDAEYGAGNCIDVNGNPIVGGPSGRNNLIEINEYDSQIEYSRELIQNRQDNLRRFGNFSV